MGLASEIVAAGPLAGQERPRRRSGRWGAGGPPASRPCGVG